MELLESIKFRSFVENLLHQNRIPGLSIAIVHNHDIASSGYGMANYEDDISCTGDTLFDIASCSKSLTAGSVALLVNDTRHPQVQYEALMSDLLPDDFVMQERIYTESITVEDLLSHRTGMARHDSSHMGPAAIRPDNAKSVTRNLRNLKAAAPVRSRYLYCNQMFTVASYLVEEISQQSFSNFLHERIFAPLNMDSTTSKSQPRNSQPKGWQDRMAKGYIWVPNDGWRALDPQNCPEGQGAGSIVSSVNDFIKWVKALLYHEDPINYPVYKGLTKMRSIVNPNARRLKAHTTPAMYTAGMEVYYYRGAMVIGHDGNIPGFATRFIFMPGHSFGAVVMGNSKGAGPASSTIIRMLMDCVLGIPLESRLLQMTPSKKTKKREGNINHQQMMRQGTEDMKDDEEKSKHERLVKKRGDNLLSSQLNISTLSICFDAYIGTYWNAGYHTLALNVKDRLLFIDATDRSMGFTMIFSDFKNQNECVAYLEDSLELTKEPIRAKFLFEAGKVQMMGLNLEPTINELIWFERRDAHDGISG